MSTSPAGDASVAVSNLPHATHKVEVPGEYSMVALLGAADEHLRIIEGAFDASVHVRGNEITITGDRDEVEAAEQLFDELIELLARGHTIDASTIRQSLRIVRDDVPERASQVLSEALLTHRGRTIRPKTLGQKRYLDAVRQNTVTFGIGPAGTGKTYLAMGAAVQALRAKQVNRLILTRPAVEAGERLGFLPGTLHEKIDPYLKPLWDALHDMMEADELISHVDRGTIEVAPLAYMRGRAQPVSTPVATPTGFVPIGDLRPGDLVIGSDGRPTPVLGVYPQGEKDVFRVTTQDGASTLACGEHLWTVWTRSDRRYGKAPRTVQTSDMVGRLRTAHYRNFELPVVAPVAFAERDVPLDAYALGLLLGDGCITGSTTPSFSSQDIELADALDEAIDGVMVRWRGGYDYVLNHEDRPRGGVIVENPATARLRELELWGTDSATKFVPRPTCTTASTSASACCKGFSTPTAAPSPSVVARADPVHDHLAAAARRRHVPRAVPRRGCVLPDARGGGAPTGPRERAARAVPGRCPRHRHPPPRRPRPLPPRPQARDLPPGGRRASNAVHRRDRARRPRGDGLHQRRGRGLAVRDRGLPRHAQHPQ